MKLFMCIMELFMCIMKNSGKSKGICNLFAGFSSFSFFTFLLPFFSSPHPTPAPTPRILAQVEQVSVSLTGNSLLSPIFPWSWALQIVTITGQRTISVVWYYLERIEIILWAEILSFFKNTSYLKTYFPSNKPDTLTTSEARDCGITEPGQAMSWCHCLTELKELISAKEEREYEENVRGYCLDPEKNSPMKALSVLKGSRHHVLIGLPSTSRQQSWL